MDGIFYAYVKVNGFTSWLHGEGSYVCNRAFDVCRSSFSAAVEQNGGDPLSFRYGFGHCVLCTFMYCFLLTFYGHRISSSGRDGHSVLHLMF